MCALYQVSENDKQTFFTTAEQAIRWAEFRHPVVPEGPWTWWNTPEKGIYITGWDRFGHRGKRYEIRRIEVCGPVLADLSERELDELAVAIDAQRARGVGRR